MTEDKNCAGCRVAVIEQWANGVSALRCMAKDKLLPWGNGRTICIFKQGGADARLCRRPAWCDRKEV